MPSKYAQLALAAITPEMAQTMAEDEATDALHSGPGFLRPSVLSVIAQRFPAKVLQIEGARNALGRFPNSFQVG